MHPTNDKRRRHTIDIIFTLSLFLLFAVSSIIAILFGIRIYSHTISSMDRNYSSRAFTAYITEKIRQSDNDSSIYIDNSNGYEQLIITQTINDEIYATSLYEYNGFLYELFSKVSIELTPDSGQKILPLSKLDFEFVSPSLLSARYIDNLGNDTVVYVSLHTAENASSDK